MRRHSAPQQNWPPMAEMGLGRVKTLYGMERDDLGEVAM
jgi:hypothetical protein